MTTPDPRRVTTFRPGWLHDQVAKSVASLDSLPPKLRAALAQPTTRRRHHMTANPTTAAERPTLSDRKIFRYVVPVDGQWHTLALSGDIVHVASRDRPDVVEVWAFATDVPTAARAFRVFGTGEPIPPAASRHVGTALTASGGLVWHLLEHEPLAEVKP